MSRRLLLNLSARAKSSALIDWAARYNPWLRSRVGKALGASSAAARAATADSLLRHIVAAARHTPYGSGRSERAEQWPVLSKQGLLAAPGDFVNRRTLLRVPASSGGTTGAPMQLWRSLECVVAEQMFLDGLLAPYGLSMRSKVAVLRADTIKRADDTAPPYGRLTHHGTRLTLSSPHLNASTLWWYLEELQRFAPDILWVYPSAAINLLRLVQRADVRVSLPLIIASSEQLSGNMHETLQGFFKAKVINYYGQAERVCLAWSTRPDEFFFEPRYGWVELTPVAPADGGEVDAARVIATGFWNAAMPLIRYDTGDLAVIPAGCGPADLSAIAAGERPFSGIAGRSGEYVLTREGLRIIGLNHIPREAENIYQVQLVQANWDTLDIDVLPMPGFRDSDAQGLYEQARAKLPASFKIHVRCVDKLRQTARGKIPFMIREV